MFVMLNFLY